MKSTELSEIIEKLGQEIIRYDRKSMEAYNRNDFEASIKYHEKAMAMEKRVSHYLSEIEAHSRSQSPSTSFSLPKCLSS